MSGETGSDGGGESLAAGIDTTVDSDDLREARSGHGLLWIAIAVVSFVALFVVLLVTGDTESGSNGPLALALLVIWVGPPLEIRRRTDSTAARLIALVPAWNLLFMFGTGVLSVVRNRRGASRVEADVGGVERVIALLFWPRLDGLSMRALERLGLASTVDSSGGPSACS